MDQLRILELNSCVFLPKFNHTLVFMSGEMPGHDSISMEFWPHFYTDFAVLHKVESCWNIHGLSPSHLFEVVSGSLVTEYIYTSPPWLNNLQITFSTYRNWFPLFYECLTVFLRHFGRNSFFSLLTTHIIRQKTQPATIENTIAVKK